MSNAVFVGRVEELQELKDSWRKACDGSTQIINLVANTGVGKTRLVQTFYEWLSTAAGQGDGIGCSGYWPDELGIGRQRVVNPPFACFQAFDLEKSIFHGFGGECIGPMRRARMNLH